MRVKGKEKREFAYGILPPAPCETEAPFLGTDSREWSGSGMVWDLTIFHGSMALDVGHQR